MANAFTRFWSYLRTKLTRSFDDRADPEVQLEEAIVAAREQHRRLREQAITVIAHQKETELRLGKAMHQQAEAEAAAKQALVSAQECSAEGDRAGALRHGDDARALAERLVALDADVSVLKESALTAAAASDQAKAALAAGQAVLREQLAEQRRLVGELEQTR
ncbi:MAG TPA: PspA/IM30 family protein, partial [Acidimicrobiales bacterium]